MARRPPVPEVDDETLRKAVNAINRHYRVRAYLAEKKAQAAGDQGNVLYLSKYFGGDK